MAKYTFTMVFERELSHEEVNDLEMALWAQCEDFRPSVAQLVRVYPKQQSDVTHSSPSTGETDEPEGSGL